MKRAIFLAMSVAACSTPQAKSPTVDGFVSALTELSLMRVELAKGTAPERINLAVFMMDDGTISRVERPTLAAHFKLATTSDARGQILELRGPLVADPRESIEVRIIYTGEREAARLVDPKTDELLQPLGSQGKVRIIVSRDPEAPASEPARLRVASLWALLGENVRAAYRPAELEAAVLGTHLVRSALPALFHGGDGHWVLLKATQPDELYFAFDATTGDAELFPKTPNEPSAAGRALFTAL